MPRRNRIYRNATADVRTAWRNARTRTLVLPRQTLAPFWSDIEKTIVQLRHDGLIKLVAADPKLDIALRRAEFVVLLQNKPEVQQLLSRAYWTRSSSVFEAAVLMASNLAEGLLEIDHRSPGDISILTNLLADVRVVEDPMTTT